MYVSFVSCIAHLRFVHFGRPVTREDEITRQQVSIGPISSNERPLRRRCSRRAHKGVLLLFPPKFNGIVMVVLTGSVPAEAPAGARTAAAASRTAKRLMVKVECGI